MPAILTTALIGAGSAIAGSVLGRKALPMQKTGGFIRAIVRLAIFGISFINPILPLAFGAVVLGRKAMNAVSNRRHPERNGREGKCVDGLEPVQKEIVQRKKQLEDKQKWLREFKQKIDEKGTLSRAEQRRYDLLCLEIPLEREALQDLFVQKGRLERAAEGTEAERLSAIHMVKEPDGSMKFYLPCDASQEQRQRMRELIIEKYGLPQDTRDILVGEHRQKDFKQGYRVDPEGETAEQRRVYTVLCFDAFSKENALDNFGEELPEEIRDFVGEFNKKFRTSVQNFTEQDGSPERLEMSGAIRMEILSPDSVGLVKDGQLLALAVAGADGKLRLNGVDTSVLSKKDLLLASRLNEDLSRCQDLNSWCEKAASHVLNRENVTVAAKATDKARKSRNRRKKIAEGLDKIIGPDTSISRSHGIS